MFSKPVHVARARIGPPGPNHGTLTPKPSSYHVHVNLRVTPPTHPCPTFSAQCAVWCNQKCTIGFKGLHSSRILFHLRLWNGVYSRIITSKWDNESDSESLRISGVEGVCMGKTGNGFHAWSMQLSWFLIARHSGYNLLQFFQWLVMLQCSGQSCGSSGSQIIVSEAAVEYNQTDTLELDLHKQIPYFCCYGNDNSSSASKGANDILSVHNSNLVHHVYHLE